MKLLDLPRPRWTVTYIGLLGYVYAITTYSLPIGDVSIVVALVGLFMQRERLRIPGPLVGLALFTGWCAVGTILTPYPGQLGDKFEVLWKLWLIALVAANALRTPAQIRFFCIFWLGCFALYPVRGALFNYYIYGENLMGRAIWNYIFQNPNDLAALCLLQLGLVFSVLMTQSRGLFHKAAMAGMILIPFLILLTRSRGAFLAFAVFLILALWRTRHRGRAIALTALATVAILFVAPSGVLDRVEGLSALSGGTSNLEEVDPEGSAAQRFEIWRVARAIISDHPIIGVGLGTYPAAHEQYSRSAQFSPIARGPRDTHSMYLNVMAETGLVGFVLFYMTCAIALIRTNRVRKRCRRVDPILAKQIWGCELGLIAFFIAGVFGSIAYLAFLWVQLMLLWCMTEHARRVLAAVRSPARQPAARARAAIFTAGTVAPEIVLRRPALPYPLLANPESR